MAAIAKLSVVVSMIILFDNVLARTSEPVTIGASPAVLPYVTAPNMSSFFPPQTNEWDLGPAAPPRLEELAPVSSSGEFIGKSSSSPAMFSNAEADRWRQQIMREIGRKVAEIQNEGLGEHRLRDLNDEINKLIREKSHWERRIVELGGPNYAKHSAKMTDLEGNIIDVPNPSGRGPGYRYFGAAKKLPGVRELFEKPPELRKRRTRYDIYKRIDASYYGYRDEEDGILEKVEGPAEEEMRVRAVEEWKRMEAIRKEARKGAQEVVSVGVGIGADVLYEEEEDVVEEERREEREREDIERKEKGREFVVHVPLPDDKEIERMVLAKKKMELLSKYASDSLMEEQTEAKAMLNIQH